jgi:hypothetical protein
MDGPVIQGIRDVDIHAARQYLAVLEYEAEMFEPESVTSTPIIGSPDTLPDHLLTGTHTNP